MSGRTNLGVVQTRSKSTKQPPNAAPRLPRYGANEDSVSGLRQRVLAPTAVEHETVKTVAPSSTAIAELRRELAEARSSLAAEQKRRADVEGQLEAALRELEELRAELDLVDAEPDEEEDLLSAPAPEDAPIRSTIPVDVLAASESEPCISEIVPGPNDALHVAPHVVDLPDYGDMVFQQVTVTSVPPPARESESPAVDRREQERHPCEFAVEFMHETQFFTGLSQDVSTGGVFIATYQPLAIGTVLDLRFALPNGAHIDATGEVRWIRERSDTEGHPGIGVAFTHLSETALTQVQAFCRSRPPLYYEL